MKTSTRLCLFITLVVFACSRHTTRGIQPIDNGTNLEAVNKTGLSIEYGPNLGATHTDEEGNRHFYVHCTATMRNDTTIPLHLHFALAETIEFPSFCGDDGFRVFILPEELTPDTATIYNGIVNGSHDFLNDPLNNTRLIEKTLEPEGYCVVTIGVLIQKPASCAAVPRAVFSHDGAAQYHSCDQHQNQLITSGAQFQIGAKLEYYFERKFIPPDDGCVVIPIGQISY